MSEALQAAFVVGGLFYVILGVVLAQVLIDNRAPRGPAIVAGIWWPAYLLFCGVQAHVEFFRWVRPKRNVRLPKAKVRR